MNTLILYVLLKTIMFSFVYWLIHMVNGKGPHIVKTLVLGVYIFNIVLVLGIYIYDPALFVQFVLEESKNYQ